MPTIQNRCNSIATLTDDVGEEKTQHADKAALLLEAFKDRLGKSEHYNIPQELLDLIPTHPDLGFLEESFTTEEIDDVIKDLPSNKSPGPNGFNTDFIKKCWSIIKKDFFDLCDQFYKGNLCLQSINNSYITLIPKKRWGFYCQCLQTNIFIELHCQIAHQTTG